MTNPNGSDDEPKSERKNLDLPFESSQMETAGIRVTRAEFSRMMECSKQCVTDWVQAGRIVVGADGRFDPSKAVRSLLATGDPAKIRSKVLAPLTLEMSILRGRIAGLEVELKIAKSNEKTHETACARHTDIQKTFLFWLEMEWNNLSRQPEKVVFEAIDQWFQMANREGHGRGLSLIEYLPDGFCDEWKVSGLKNL